MKRQQRLRGDEGEVPQVSLRLSPGCGSVLAAAQSWLRLSPGCSSVLAADQSWLRRSPGANPDILSTLKIELPTYVVHFESKNIFFHIL
jgi:hypothetical protein